MKQKPWMIALPLAAVAALATSCGSEGSLANSGSNDWSFDGTGSRATNASGASGAGTTAGGTGPNGGASSGSGTVSGSAGSSVTGTSSGYHQLANWTTPSANNPNHHGSAYFLGNAHKDENGTECTSCHGRNYEGESGPACASCHSEWRSSCTFCHGSEGVMGGPPPLGVWGETSTTSLAVGKHTAHLSAGSSHQAFACSTCHQVPAADDIEHTLGYEISADLSVPGHHGDVTLTSSVPGMAWNLDASSGTPISMRGTCVGGCHSDGRGGPPRTTAYWAGGNWTSGCANCHSDRPNSGTHRHALEEGASCANCHAGSTTNMYSAASHLNGSVDYLGTVAGQGMTLTADANCASGVRCNGLCHGEDEDHNNRCW